MTSLTLALSSFSAFSTFTNFSALRFIESVDFEGGSLVAERDRIGWVLDGRSLVLVLVFLYGGCSEVVGGEVEVDVDVDEGGGSGESERREVRVVPNS
jgi:hypothetical protein